MNTRPNSGYCFQIFLSTIRSMANPPSKFEQLIVNNWPVQTSIIQNLTGWDFRNLQLAGVPISLSKTLQRKLQIPIRCDERDPEKYTHQCTNTETFDEIRACKGHPWHPWDETTLLNWHEAEHEHDKPCLQKDRMLYWGNPPNNEPNTSKYPIHSKVCRRCRDFWAARWADSHLREIARFGQPLCQQHSLEQANQFPLNTCRCFDFIHGKWRCMCCCVLALYYLETRCFLQKAAMNPNLPENPSSDYLISVWSSVWDPEVQLCPIEGCTNPPWVDECRSERMQRCLACDVLTRI